MSAYYQTCGTPKPRPRILEKRERKALLASEDRAERKKCRLRSGGRCEVILVTHKSEESAIEQKRCKRKATTNHHLLGGIGRRNIGASILAAHRIDMCGECHNAIDISAIYEPYVFDEAYDAATVRYIEVVR